MRPGIRYGRSAVLLALAAVYPMLSFNEPSTFHRFIPPGSPQMWIIAGGIAIIAVSNLFYGTVVVGTRGIKVPYRTFQSWDRITAISTRSFGTTEPLVLRFTIGTSVWRRSLGLRSFHSSPREAARVVISYAPPHVDISDDLHRYVEYFPPPERSVGREG